MKIKNLQSLFETGLRYAYDSEQKLAEKGIPSMIEAAGAPELRSAFEQHLQETRNHVVRLKRVFAIIGVEPKTEDNDIIDEITDAAEDMVDATEDGSPLRDVVLILSGNQVEHNEIASYGTLLSFAKRLGLTDAAQLLQETLNEEKAADAKLTQIAESSVNPKATQQLRAA